MAETPAIAMEQQLVAIWTDVLDCENVQPDDNFFELGGDSIMSVQVVSRARTEGLSSLTPHMIFQHQTIRELARAMADLPVAAQTRLDLPPEGEVPLTPAQLWWLDGSKGEVDRANLSGVIDLGGRYPRHAVKQAFLGLIGYHDALRLSLREDPRGWVQECLPDSDANGVFLELSGDEIGSAAGWSRLVDSLDVRRPPLIRVGLPAGDELAQVMVAIHHLAVDAVSWRVLIQDLGDLLARPSAASAEVLPPKTASYRSWAQALLNWSHGEMSRSELARWEDISARGEAAAATVASSNGLSVSERPSVVHRERRELEAAGIFGALRRLGSGMSMRDVVVTAVASAVAAQSGKSSAYVAMEGHGRQEVPGMPPLDVSRTVGWFTALYPVVLPTDKPHFTDNMVSIHEVLEQIPSGGVGFGVLRYMNHDPFIRSRLASMKEPSIVVNYLGRTVDTRSAGPALIGPIASKAVDGAQADGFMTDVTASVFHDSLVIEWTHLADEAEGDIVRVLADNTIAAIRSMGLS